MGGRGQTSPKRVRGRKKMDHNDETCSDNNDATCSEAETWECRKCSQTLRDNDGCQALTCDGCCGHFCLPCTTITQPEFKALRKLQRNDVCWFCEPCLTMIRTCFKNKNTSPTSTPVILEKLTAIEHKVTTLENKLDMQMQQVEMSKVE